MSVSRKRRLVCDQVSPNMAVRVSLGDIGETGIVVVTAFRTRATPGTAHFTPLICARHLT